MGHHDERLSSTIRLRMWQDTLLLISEQAVLPAHVRCQLREIARLLDAKRNDAPVRIRLRAVRT